MIKVNRFVTALYLAALALSQCACHSVDNKTTETHMKKNIGQKMALYPTPATVIGTVGEDGKVNWMLCAHVGIATHSKLMLSIHSSHFTAKNTRPRGCSRRWSGYAIQTH